MIGRLLRGGFMTAIYAYLYIPIIILIVNSFTPQGDSLPPDDITVVSEQDAAKAVEGLEDYLDCGTPATFRYPSSASTLKLEKKLSPRIFETMDTFW